MKYLLAAFLLLAGTALAQEGKLLAVLQSNAPLKEKADACRELARVGTKAAVPVLASFLADESLSHMARYALEPIADPSVDAALRAQLPRLQGQCLAGTIASIGARKDAAAVAPLAPFLSSPDPEIVQVTARALGRIGGPAAPVLEKAVMSASAANQIAICEGLLRCAESLPPGKATGLYDRVRRLPNVPLQVQVAALRGAIKSRGPKGISLLVETLRGDSYALAAAAMKISSEIPGKQVTQALAAEIPKAKPERQLLILQTLGYRGDAAAASTLSKFAQEGPLERRAGAIRSLAQLGLPTTLPTLVTLAHDPEPTVANAAQAGLIGFPGTEADAIIIGLLSDRNPKIRSVCTDAAGQRRIKASVPVLLKAATDPDISIASASFRALGDIVEADQIPGVVNSLLRTKALEAAENALTVICERQPDSSVCADGLLPGLGKAQGEAKLVLLRVLRTVGSPKALIAVRAAAKDSDPSVRETALRALCEWPTAEALQDLVQITKAKNEDRFRILALQGQLRLIPILKASDAQKVAQLQELLPSLERKEEQRLALATLGALPCKESLLLIEPYLSRDGLKEEAAGAAVDVAEKISTTHSGVVSRILPQVQTANKQVTERIQKLQAKLPKETAGGGFTSIFNGKDLAEWSSKPGWWTVEDGALTAESTTQKPCKECNYLIWKGGQPANFELLADYKLSREGNSGIQIRSEERPDWDTFGYQADMSGDGALVGFVYHHSRGLIAGRGEKAEFAEDGKKTVKQLGTAEELLKHYRIGDWNTYRILCQGSKIALYVNEVLMCQIDDHHAKEAASKGIIALQMHPGPPMKVQFKNIQLRELK